MTFSIINSELIIALCIAYNKLGNRSKEPADVAGFAEEMGVLGSLLRPLGFAFSYDPTRQASRGRQGSAYALI